jgi:hypothetical protein
MKNFVVVRTFRFPFSEPGSKPGFKRFVIFLYFQKNKIKKWLIDSFRTDGRTSITYITCIALHCIVHIYCIALTKRYVHCIAYWLNNNKFKSKFLPVNVLPPVHDVFFFCLCPSAFFGSGPPFQIVLLPLNVNSKPFLPLNVLPPIGSVCLCFFVRQLFLARTSVRTDRLTWLYDWTETEITETCLSIRDIRTYWHFLHWYFHFSKVKWHIQTSVRPYIQISICRGPEFETWLQQDFVILFFKNEKKIKKWLTDFIPLRTDGLPLHCIALHCIARCIVLHCIALYCITCIALHCTLYCVTCMHCMLTERNVNSTACLLLNCAIGHV